MSTPTIDTPEETPQDTPEETPQDTPEETPQDTPEETPQDEIFNKLKENYEKKITDMRVDYETKLQSKDKIILELLNEDAPAENNIAAIVNKNREIKKY